MPAAFVLRPTRATQLAQGLLVAVVVADMLGGAASSGDATAWLFCAPVAVAFLLYLVRSARMCVRVGATTLTTRGRLRSRTMPLSAVRTVRVGRTRLRPSIAVAELTDGTALPMPALVASPASRRSRARLARQVEQLAGALVDARGAA
ncbi:MAG: PH domain-containing protein [Nocardioidaceae bacterium]